ncbi:hypothetical protein H1O16_gp394 [Burkholderia phage BcepSaruman]|uniref:Uncharacterized protein n=1 Tax=Burkholderia phage BcepSaruman TaxID=2530032 RepID=A0A4D5ZEV4_9CAUD|nr:hypothetical protein H1O16_gp394 [Burkholderia phage BcepSaruman]QBX06807.1 hypothetical protein BcepSaruman_394 [Burkholderia phage BcepSaruman]
MKAEYRQILEEAQRRLLRGDDFVCCLISKIGRERNMVDTAEDLREHVYGILAAAMGAERDQMGFRWTLESYIEKETGYNQRYLPAALTQETRIAWIQWMLDNWK